MQKGVRRRCRGRRRRSAICIRVRGRLSAVAVRRGIVGRSGPLLMATTEGRVHCRRTRRPTAVRRYSGQPPLSTTRAVRLRQAGRSFTAAPNGRRLRLEGRPQGIRGHCLITGPIRYRGATVLV